eukprot:580375-Rhodomonas_salina.1
MLHSAFSAAASPTQCGGDPSDPKSTGPGHVQGHVTSEPAPRVAGTDVSTRAKDRASTRVQDSSNGNKGPEEPHATHTRVQTRVSTLRTSQGRGLRVAEQRESAS